MLFNRRGRPEILKIVIVIGIIGGLTSLTAIFIHSRHVLDDPQRLIEALPDDANLSIDDIHHTATRDGKTEWVLDADSARYVDANKTVLLDNLAMTFFLENQQNVQLRADSGTLQTESRNVTVNGNVVVVRDSTRLNTESLLYQHNERLLTTDRPVEISDEAYRLTAESMSLDLQRNQAVFKGNVRGVFQGNLSL